MSLSKIKLIYKKPRWVSRFLINKIFTRSFDPLSSGYKFLHNEKLANAYNKYYKTEPQRYESSYGLKFVDDICRIYKFKTVLDAGCGAGIVVREFRKRGYQVRGIELSDWVVENNCLDLYEKGLVQVGALGKLPYKNNSFDLVFSSDVLEHIPERSIPFVISELIRVSKHDLFLSINLRPSSENNAYHITLKSREWWTQKFVEAGAKVNFEVVKKLQKRRPGASNGEILELGPAKSLLSEMDWFIKDEPYSFQGELEPWIFAFKKVI